MSAPLPESRFERSLVTTAQIEAFAADGVVKVPQAIDRRWIDRLLALAEQQLARPSRWLPIQPRRGQEPALHRSVLVEGASADASLRFRIRSCAAGWEATGVPRCAFTSTICS